MKQKRTAALIAFIQARFSPQGQLGLHLTAGVLLLVAATTLFAEIAEDVMDGDAIVGLDHQVAQWFHANASAPLTRILLAVTHLHSAPGLIAMALLFAAYLLWKKDRYWLLSLLLAVPGGMLLNVFLKEIFQRARPSFEEPLLTLGTYSFPSGHAVGGTVFYGVLAAYLVCAVRDWRRRSLVIAAAVAMVTLVALTRVYLGVHYFSDVLAGIIVGTAWLAFVLPAVSTLRRRRLHR